MSEEFAEVIDRLLEQKLQARLLSRALRDYPETERERLLGQIDRLSHRLATLIESARTMGTEQPLEDLLRRLLALISEAFDAERSSLFLYDDESGELYSRLAEGDLVDEIRFPATVGIAGEVFTSGQGRRVDDAYAEPGFNRAVDEETGYLTRSILCVPVRTQAGEIIGVAEVLNCRHGHFSPEDQLLLTAFTCHISVLLEKARLTELVQRSRHGESQIRALSQVISSELRLDALLEKTMSISSEILDAERSTLFLHDPERHQLWSRVAEGLEHKVIRIPEDAGIAGTVWHTGRPIIIPDAYQDRRFRPEVDRETGFRTRSVLSVPIIGASGQVIGVMQVLNKRSGTFTRRDQYRLEVLAAQSAIALENAQCYEELVRERDFTDTILESMGCALVVLDHDFRVSRVNLAARRLLGLGQQSRLVGRELRDLTGGDNDGLLEAVARVAENGSPAFLSRLPLLRRDERVVEIDLGIDLLPGEEGQEAGYVLSFRASAPG